MRSANTPLTAQSSGRAPEPTGDWYPEEAPKARRNAALGFSPGTAFFQRLGGWNSAGRLSEDYAAYRPGFPASFYQRLDAIVRLGGARVLDLATGPGTMALELGARGSSVVGIDVSAQQIATARRVAKERNLEDAVGFRVATAENTGLEAGSGGLSPSEVVRFDEALRRLLRDKYPDPMVVEHRVWCVVARA